MTQEDQFEITVGGCVVKFDGYQYDGRLVITVTTSPDDCDDTQFYYASGIGRSGLHIIGSLELVLMPSFDVFRDHILKVVPEEARRRGVEPYHLSEIREASRHCDYEEAVILTIISAGDWDEFAIQMERDTNIYLVRRMRDTIRELRKQLAEKK